MALIVGMDGCPKGWLAVILELETYAISARILSSISELPGLGEVSCATIDIPIGLTDGGPRGCDIEARKLIGERRSSVFNAPIRPMLAAKTYLESCDIGLSADGRKISKQCWAIVPKIREVDSFLQSNPDWQEKLYEIHPEVAFTSWGNAPMSNYKKTPLGQIERQALIAEHFGTEFKKCLTGLPTSGFALDDVLDAFSALWVAEKIARGKAKSIPEVPLLDSTGLPMRMML